MALLRLLSGPRLFFLLLGCVFDMLLGCVFDMLLGCVFNCNRGRRAIYISFLFRPPLVSHFFSIFFAGCDAARASRVGVRGVRGVKETQVHTQQRVVGVAVRVAVRRRTRRRGLDRDGWTRGHVPVVVFLRVWNDNE